MIKEAFRIDAGEGVHMRGTPNGDRLVGTEKNDILHGLEGNDVFVSSGGHDHIYGGAGFDTVSYHEQTDPLVVFLKGVGASLVHTEHVIETHLLESPAAAEQTETESTRADAPLHNGGSGSAAASSPPTTVVHAVKDKLWSVEAVIGGQKADWLIGNAFDNTLVGGPDADILVGSLGSDYFAYWDCCLPPTATGAVDAILDFSPHWEDRIDLSVFSDFVGTRLVFAGVTESDSSDTPYSVFYKVGLDPDKNPFSEDCPFTNEDGTPRFKAEDGLALMVDLDGDARSDFTIAVWGVSEIEASDLIL